MVSAEDKATLQRKHQAKVASVAPARTSSSYYARPEAGIVIKRRVVSAVAWLGGGRWRQPDAVIAPHVFPPAVCSRWPVQRKDGLEGSDAAAEGEEIDGNACRDPSSPTEGPVVNVALV